MLVPNWYSKLPLVALLASSAVVLLLALLRHADAQAQGAAVSQPNGPSTGVMPPVQSIESPVADTTSAESNATESVADQPVAVVPPSPLSVEEAPSLTVPVPQLKPPGTMSPEALSPEALAKDPLFQEMRKLLSQPNNDLDVPPIDITSPLEIPRGLAPQSSNPLAVGMDRMESVQLLANAAIQLLREAQALEAVGQPTAAAELKTMAEQLRLMIARLAR